MFNAHEPSNQLCIEIEIDRFSKYYNSFRIIFHILTAERWLNWVENFKASIPFRIKPINHKKLLKSIMIIFQFDFCFIKTINHKRFIMFKKTNLPRNKNVKRIFGHLLLTSYKHGCASKSEQNYEFSNNNQRNSDLMTLVLSLKNYTIDDGIPKWKWNDSAISVVKLAANWKNYPIGNRHLIGLLKL